MGDFFDGRNDSRWLGFEDCRWSTARNNNPVDWSKIKAITKSGYECYALEYWNINKDAFIREMNFYQRFSPDNSLPVYQYTDYRGRVIYMPVIGGRIYAPVTCDMLMFFPESQGTHVEGWRNAHLAINEIEDLLTGIISKTPVRMHITFDFDCDVRTFICL